MEARHPGQQVVVPAFQGQPGEDQRPGREVEAVRAPASLRFAVLLGEPLASHGDDAAPGLRQLLAEVLLERDARPGEELEGQIAADVHDDEVVAHDLRRPGNRQHDLVRQDLVHLGGHQRPDAPLGDELVDARPVGLAGPRERVAAVGDGDLGVALLGELHRRLDGRVAASHHQYLASFVLVGVDEPVRDLDQLLSRDA